MGRYPRFCHKPPKCAGCLFGAMTKLPWRGNDSASSHEVFVATKPGEIVSVNQMESAEVGFFAQLNGSLTKKRYRYCTVFVDCFSQLCFVHLQFDDSAAETMLAKQAFEKFAAEHGGRILHHCHCDNRQFANNAWKQSCKASRQQLTFCGVNSHLQNGIAKCAIRDLLENAHKQLLYAHACWPAVVHFALWPYALHNAALLHNSLPVLEDGTSRLEPFSSIQVECNMKHVHIFCVPSVHVKKCINFRQVATQMISTCQIRPQPRTQSYPWKECLFGMQFDEWVCISTVPLLV
jgi:hypothetical protein